jgi:hypothetical protein
VSEADKLRKQGSSFAEAIYLVNKVSQDLLVRPLLLHNRPNDIGDIRDQFYIFLVVTSRLIPNAKDGNDPVVAQGRPTPGTASRRCR